MNCNFSKLVCDDTNNWDDGQGWSCTDYEEYYCENGQAKSGYEYRLTKAYNHPEENCCVCKTGCVCKTEGT